MLILPVDASQHILSYAQADAIVERINPHIVIPEHYLTKGVSITLSTLGSALEWTMQQKSHEVLNTAELVLNPNQVARHERHVMYFGDHHKSE